MSASVRFAPAARVTEVIAHSLRPSTRPGKDLVSLASGEPDFDTPAHITRALVEAIEGGATHYGAWDGDPELRAALAETCGTGERRDRAAEEVLITHGGSGALAAALLGTLNPGDEVIVTTPTYSLYADLARLAGAQPRTVPLTEGFRLDLDAIAAVAPAARMITLCNPGNPTGSVCTADELRALAAIAEEHDLLVVSDEAYERIVYPGSGFTSALDVPELADRLLYVQTFSKTYAMTGWRLGYLCAPADVVRSAALVHRTFAGPLNTAIQRAGLAAVVGDQGFFAPMLAEYTERRELVLDALQDIPGVTAHRPEGAFYVLVDHRALGTSAEIVTRARDNGLAVRSGAEFGAGGEGHVRLSFATDRERLERGLALLRETLTIAAER
ncbi:Aspartate aminotransferase [Baekduia alba]|uniref:pyridoxal phosphate-dependent aminotransferase n=1 Tax=Baekduia alba TaxID=2997333 RepID=UPI002340BD90|nr:aminotransferase class I/II-fold pyridoxal phosphate-dependent enzyme [Baekduia alba]WCB96331.1 Aspartate aminotransferase [Baekduia alba]